MTKLCVFVNNTTKKTIAIRGKLEKLEQFAKLSKMDRKAELERKKAKLQALREEKDRRRKEKEMKDLEEAAGKLGHPESNTRK